MQSLVQWLSHMKLSQYIQSNKKKGVIKLAENFYTVLTDIGLAKFANAQITQQKVEFSEIVVGDSNGSYYNPISTQTSLNNEVWRGPIAQVEIDQVNPNWVVVESVIPSSVGGFTIREVGLYDSVGDLIAVGKYPQTFKPKLEQGTTKDLYIRMVIESANASVVSLKIDPAIILASRKYVDERIKGHEDKAATENDFGHVKIGDGLKIEKGVVSADFTEFENANSELLETTKEIKTVQDEINTNTKGVSTNVAAVKSLVGIPNPTTADETTVMNYLKKIHQTQLPVGGLKPIVTHDFSGPGQGVSKVLEINGSGFLRKAAFVKQAATGSITTVIKITIDDVVILNNSISNSGPSAAYGIVDGLGTNLTQGNATSVFVGMRAAVTANSVLKSYDGTPMSVSNALINLGGMKIPFNKNLKVEFDITNIPANDVEYEILAEVY